MTNQYLTFMLRGEEYAVAVLRVKEIIQYETVTHVPTVPAHVRGVINLRGAVLPVIDLSAKFGHATSEPTATTCIVVVETRVDEEVVMVGVVADAVSRVLDLSPEQIEAPPSFGTHVRVDFLVGRGKVDERLVLVLDLDRILCAVETIDVVETSAEVLESLAS